MCANSVINSKDLIHSVGPSSITTVLQDLHLIPISKVDPKKLIVSHHYSHSFPGGTKLTFGVILKSRLLGVMAFGVGPYFGYKLVDEATPDDAITLTRLWLSDELPGNSESRVLGIALRSLRKDTNLKFVIAYSDPAAGHLGTIYQATNWLYTDYQQLCRYMTLEMEHCIIQGLWPNGLAAIQYAI